MKLQRKGVFQEKIDYEHHTDHTYPYMHDTHVHVDLLLQKLGHIEDRSSADLDEAQLLQISPLIDELFSAHSFAIQATVDTDNYIMMHRMLARHSKFALLMGSHPEIVTDSFEYSPYIKRQSELLQSDILSETSTISTDQLGSHTMDDGIWSYSAQNILRIFPRLATHRLIGLGEIGLDYFYTQEAGIINKQRDLVDAQLNLTKEHSLPVVFHCRDAFDDLFSIIDNHPAIHGRFMVHCFTGTTEHLKKILTRGGIAAFGGVSTFKNAQYLREAFAYCPLDGFTLETDLPFLAPTPLRGKVCLPEYIEHTAKALSEIKSI